MHILLVEDNELNRDMLLRRLSRHGITCSIATDGVQAVELARVLSPDVILMDIGLPDLDGWEATRRIKECPATGAIPIIILTAHVFVEDRDRATEFGCFGFVPKPINLPVLLETIRNAVSRRATVSAAPKDEQCPS